MTVASFPAKTFFLLGCLSTQAFAHGESVRGVGGAGVNTTGGEIADEASVSVRYDLRSYGLFSDADLLDWQNQGENVHQHEREHTILLNGTIPIHERFDLSMLLQANRFENFTDNGDAFALANRSLSRTDISQGLGDFLLLGRYQVHRRGDHKLAAIGGVKLPTGVIRRATNNGEIVGTHNQPGSGSVDMQVGAGYAGRLGAIQVSADMLFRVNTEGAKSFRSGNSVQADVAAGYRMGPLVPSIELNAYAQERDIEEDEIKRNSGVRSLFATAAIRGNFGRHALFAAVAVPLWQDFPGISNTENVRFSTGYAITLGHAHQHGHKHVNNGTKPPQQTASR